MKLLKPSDTAYTPVLRQKHRKVKSGCRTCKKRRIKCDETYPSCTRCVSAKRVCEGYGIWGGGNITPSTAITTKHPLPIFTSTTTPILKFPADIRITETQQSYLHWFIHDTPHHTPRIFTSPFWDPVILQLSVREPMVLRALLALSAVHKSFPLGLRGSEPGGEVFMLGEYGGALRGLRGYLSNEGGSGEVCRSGGVSRGGEQDFEKGLVALAMCSLFVFMEYIRGEFESGGLHLAMGVKIVRRLRGSGTVAKQMEREYYRIFHFFDRFADQTAIFRAKEGRRVARSSMQCSGMMPSLRFKDVEEARYHLEDLVEIMAQVESHAGNMAMTGIAPKEVVRREHAYLAASFEAWRLAVDATVEELEGNVTEEEDVAWGALLLRYESISKGVLV